MQVTFRKKKKKNLRHWAENDITVEQQFKALKMTALEKKKKN